MTDETFDEYLGDEVYASFDGYHIILDLRGQDSTTVVHLEPAVFDKLIRYRERMLASKKEQP